MAIARFSEDAEADLDGIAQYTVQHWGREQADFYLDQLLNACRKLAASPDLGRPCGPSRPEVRRYEVGSHVVFFRTESPDIFVSRILHKRMLPEKHF